MIPVEKGDGTLDSEPFTLDEVRFNLIHKINDYAKSLLVKSESGRAIFAQSNWFPVWVWTAEGLDKDELDVLAQEFNKYFEDRQKLEIIAKPEIAHFIAEAYSRKKNITCKYVMQMQSYHCPAVHMPDRIDGELCKPSIGYMEAIAEFLSGFIFDSFGVETAPVSQIQSARKYIESGDFYVWKVNDEIVSMANIAHRSPRHARINEVYTPVGRRNRGYASALVAAMSKLILDDGLTPVLYTDLSNPVSNKIYKNIGYIECGQVDHISFEL